MKTAYLEDANQDAVSEAVTTRLKERDALVTVHTHSRVRFEGLTTGERYSFPRSGYVGVYHHTGESEVELRLKLDARLPARLFYGTCIAIPVAFALLLALDAEAGLWSGTTIFLGFAFVATLLLYVGTFRATRRLERELFDDLLSFVRAIPLAPREVVSEEDRELSEFEAALEAEVLERRLAEERKSRPVAAAPKQPGGASRFSLGRKREAAAAPEPAESPEEKRARLLAKREELERKRKGDESP